MNDGKWAGVKQYSDWMQAEALSAHLDGKKIASRVHEVAQGGSQVSYEVQVAAPVRAQALELVAQLR